MKDIGVCFIIVFLIQSLAYPMPQQVQYQETEMQRQIQYQQPPSYPYYQPYNYYPPQPSFYPPPQQPLMDFQAYKNKSFGIDSTKERFHAGYQNYKGVQAKGATENAFNKALDKVFD
ncbi:hypothetical protein PVAND_007025 [Polypedilum vanderplanki]|uniref:Uncharacterized protein n=1 Tax=Polypedilum vanderplanki TaxID=319348 RepID=A0A9J6C5S5_POLVA|nr:hypothetical protein PVAND_007025 [Polypedilum vanderplanki]